MVPQPFLFKQLELFQKKYFEIEQQLREIELQIVSFGENLESQSTDFVRIQKKMKVLIEKQKETLQKIQQVNACLKTKAPSP
jgi:hypothetical protein